jgi:ADP-heptose:LPS heptosyltransferase
MKNTRCLILQLSSLSAILKNLMSLRAVKHLYPNLEITLVVQESHAATLQSISWISEVVALPQQKPVSDGLQNLARWVKPLVQERWDFVVNWSFSESSSYLTALLPGIIYSGYCSKRLPLRRPL